VKCAYTGDGSVMSNSKKWLEFGVYIPNSKGQERVGRKGFYGKDM
jgi:hypothetical protein